MNPRDGRYSEVRIQNLLILNTKTFSQGYNGKTR
jgi:hypothetical protein